MFTPTSVSDIENVFVFFTEKNWIEMLWTLTSNI